MLFLCGLMVQFLHADDAKAIRGEVRVGHYENHPKIFTDEKGDPAGFFPEVMRAIAEAEGWSLRFISGTWGEGLDRLAAGEIDILPDVAVSDERQQLYAFNDETVLISWAAIYSRSDLQLLSFRDLSGLRIALLEGGIYSTGPSSIRDLLEQMGIVSTYIEFPSYTEVFLAVSERRADAGVVNNIFGYSLQQFYDVVASPILFNPSQLRFAFNKNSPATPRLKEGIDARLGDMRSDPQSAYYRAMDRYLSGMPRETVQRNDYLPFVTPEEQQWIANHPRIRLGIDPEFYPFVFFDDQGRFDGMGADYVELLNQRLGLSMQATEPMGWHEAMEAFRRGEIDVLPAVGITEERLEYALFTKPFIEYQRVLLARTDLPFIAGLEDVGGLRVGVQADSSHEGFLRDSTTIDPVLFPTLNDALMALSSGKIDLLVGNLASSTYWIRRLNLLNLKVAAPVGDQAYSLHFAVRKDWPELVNLLDKGLSLIDPADHQEIRSRWVRIDYRRGIEPRVAWRIAIRAALVVLLILGLISAWTIRLKKEVTRRRVIEKQLQFRVRFERLVSETSSRFVSIPSEEVPQAIQLAMTELACFLGSTAVYLYHFDEAGCPEQKAAGGQLGRLDQMSIHPADDPPDSPWLCALKAKRPVVMRAEGGLPGSTPTLEPPPVWLKTGGIIEVPCLANDQVRGFLGMIDLDGTATPLREEDISLFQLFGQMFHEALQRKETDDALHRSAEHLEAANRRLQEVDRLKSMFIASVSHELRTPLNSIIGFTGVLLKGLAGDLNPTQQDQLGRVYESAKHLLGLITDIIDISKIEAGHIDVHSQTFDMREVVEDVLETIRPISQCKGLHLSAHLSEGMTVVADRKRVRQCLLNYLSNAVKYSEKGTVGIEVQAIDGVIEVVVSDEGIGIPAEEASRLFSPFVRLDSHLRIPAGGSGLGLYLTRKIVVELLHGEVGVTSRPGEGSRFCFRFPQKVQESSVPGEGEHS
ncbi:MAG TPA: transporter substrate-binding domain-containing protein [Kiritimatiellia bacterium]|nr:transporter substrate-binding domain-containing protein [Kiritimatiellia bacterium]